MLPDVIRVGCDFGAVALVEQIDGQTVALQFQRPLLRERQKVFVREAEGLHGRHSNHRIRRRADELFRGVHFLIDCDGLLLCFGPLFTVSHQLGVVLVNAGNQFGSRLVDRFQAGFQLRHPGEQ